MFFPDFGLSLCSWISCTRVLYGEFLVAFCKCKQHVYNMKDLRESDFFEKKRVQINAIRMGFNIQYSENL